MVVAVEDVAGGLVMVIEVVGTDDIVIDVKGAVPEVIVGVVFGKVMGVVEVVGGVVIGMLDVGEPVSEVVGNTDVMV